MSTEVHWVDTLFFFLKELLLPLFWALCFPPSVVHTSVSGLSPPAAEPQCLLRSGQRHRDAVSQIWRELIKESTDQVFHLLLIIYLLNSAHISSLFLLLRNDGCGHEPDLCAQLTTSHVIIWACQGEFNVYKRILQSIVGPVRLFIQSHEYWNQTEKKRKRKS